MRLHSQRTTPILPHPLIPLLLRRRAEIRDYYGRDVRSWYREAWLDVRSEGPAASDEDSEDADGEEIESRLDEENLRFEQCLAALEADAPLADAQFEFGVAWGFTPERNGPDWCERWAADYGNVTMGMELSGSRCISSWSISQAPNIML